MARRTEQRRTEQKRSGKVRYAVVGMGHIAQVAVLPAFRHARRNSVLAALVSDDPAKIARSFPLAAERYGSGLLPFIRAVRERGSLMAIGE